ncbi:MAG TPA: polyphosphate kinase 1 [Vicinamibacterales bacterium]|nr:polyphosphate kinase 1 [Vicinamibacterales bacterium]
MSPTALRAARRPRRLPTGAAGAQVDNSPEIDLRNPDLYFDRELSWLSFNERVLDQARSGHPLLERVKFLAIAANNLDEFFMVRLDERPSLARGRATAMLDEISEYWAEGLRPQLAGEQIVVVDPPEYTEDDRTFVEKYFNVHVCPVLTPLAFDPGHPFPHISNRSRNLAVVVDHRGRTKFARVKVPDLLSRFVALPAASGTYRFALLEDVIRENLGQLFPGVRIRTAHFFRVVRDMEMTVPQSHDADETLLEVVDRGLKEQRHGPLSLLEVEHGMPTRVLEILIENFEVGRDVVVRSRGRMGLADWIQLLTIPRPDLKDRPFSPSKLWRKGSPDIFDEIRDHDQFVHHPFDSFQSVEAFVDAAIDDPRVFAIKMTLYRIGANSPLVDRLIKAAERGKQVAVLVELKARFDERSNIDWATRLEGAGVHVVYGVEQLKTHCKICLVVRKEGDEIRRYLHIATGNYNRATAKIYTDMGLFTADPQLVADASELFNYLTGYSNQTDYREMFVAPVALRRRFGKLVAREIGHARRGRAARMIIKCNALTDPRIIRLLYRASQAGVTVDLIIRGVCTLRPGVPGVSDNIRVRSIVGRFLEHSRIFHFDNDGAPEVYIGSADLMERNLNKRVEAVTPIRDPDLAQFIRYVVIEAYLRDNVRARLLGPDGHYEPVSSDGAPFDAQLTLMSRRLRAMLARERLGDQP